MLPEALFQTSDDDLLLSVYAKQGRTLDDLPYTTDFEVIYAAMGDESLSRGDLFHRLANLRKAGRLPRLGRAPAPPPRIDLEAQVILTELVEDRIGTMGVRDRLPYTPQFDQIVCTFNALAGLSLTAHDVWRLIAKLAK